jgi:hypothetical protein
VAQRFIRIGKVEVDGGLLTAPIDCSPELERYFVDRRFWADYGDTVDLSGIPPSILAIPAVGSVAGVAWAVGADLVVDELDARYRQALTEVAAVIQSIYPSFHTGRSAVRGRIVANDPRPDQGRVGLLFSGGLDANTSLIEHADRVTDLFTIWGADVPLANQPLWSRLTALIEANPAAATKTRHRIASNLRSLLDNGRLGDEFGSVILTGAWWSGVQVGLGMQSLIAPAAFALGMRRVMEASSLTAAPGTTYIFSPDVDEKIAWAGAAVAHDSFHRSRQQKIHEVLAPYLRSADRLPLAVCYERGRGGLPTINCGVCEKCLRTQVGLLLEGIDPVVCGFHMEDDALDQARDRFERNGYMLEPVQISSWHDIQRGLPADLDRLPDIRGSRRFFAWLRGLDVDAYARRAYLAHQPFLKACLIVAGGPVLRALPPELQRRVRPLIA